MNNVLLCWLWKGQNAVWHFHTKYQTWLKARNHFFGSKFQMMCNVEEDHMLIISWKFQILKHPGSEDINISRLKKCKMFGQTKWPPHSDSKKAIISYKFKHSYLYYCGFIWNKIFRIAPWYVKCSSENIFGCCKKGDYAALSQLTKTK